MKAKLIWIGALALALMVTGLSSSAQAQCLERIQDEISKTHDMLEHVKERMMTQSDNVSSTDLERGKALFEIAHKLNREAENLCSNGNGALALKLTMESREKARAALGAINLSDQTEPSLERRLLRTDELLARVREVIRPDMPRPVLERVDRAFDTQRRAWEAFHGGHPRVALKLTSEAERMLRDIMRELPRGAMDDLGPERHIEQVGELIHHLSERISECDNEEAKKLITQARDAFENARQLFADGHKRQAATSLQLARELAQKAQVLCGVEDRIEVHIEKLDRKAEVLHVQAREKNNIEALKLIEAALDNLNQAKRLLADELPRAAAGQLRAADLLLNQAQDKLNGR